MRILVIGSGGREHAICDALAKSARVTALFCAPGNAGIAEIAQCEDISPLDFSKIIEFSRKMQIDLVFVAPDDPLALGLVDKLEEAGISAFGPTKDAAIIEGSKVFAKAFMQRHNIPTADYKVFCDYQNAREYVTFAKYPLVIKADGLAFGKGVIICNTQDSAVEALDSIMLEKKFGQAGQEVVIEEFLEGREATVLVFTDGNTVKCMPASQDHKKAFDNDKGPNTGGMGAFAPTPYYTPDIEQETLDKIIIPTIKGLREENRKFCGVLYFGLMMTNNGVKVIEYNARFGDPETQVILPLLETDFAEIILAIKGERLKDLTIKWKKDTMSLCVVVASGGYPMDVVKGYPIHIRKMADNIQLFHSGTALKDNNLVTNGGRVICVTTLAKNLDSARKNIYDEIDKIEFEGKRYRKDIGAL